MQERKKDFGIVLLVLSAGIAAALLIGAFFVSYYGPSGFYQLKQVLLNPETLLSLNYNDWNPKINGQDKFIFDQILYEVNGLSPKKINIEKYKKIYHILNHDKSTTDIQTNIYSMHAPKLSLYVRSESLSPWRLMTKVFQQIQISDSGNYYRVELREDNNWVEFFHPEIKQQLEVIVNND